MITIDINIAIASFISLSLVLVFSLWLFYNFREVVDREDSLEKIVECPYCTHLFKEIRSDLIRCTHCKSVIELSENFNDEANKTTK